MVLGTRYEVEDAVVDDASDSICCLDFLDGTYTVVGFTVCDDFKFQSFD